MRRGGRRLTAALGVVTVTASMALAGCGDAPNPPIAIVQNYLNALGGGEYNSACGMVDNQAFAALARTKHVHMSCATLFRLCLPHQSLQLKKDQTQLLYANINVALSDKGTVANADTSATPVATELKHVTLRHEHGIWKFTGFGQAIEACRPTAHRHKPKPKHHQRHKS